MPFKVSVSTGLYHIGGAEELSSTVKKIGYTLTRGVDSIELAGDTPHEIDYTIGKEIRYIAEKQGIIINFHGSLYIAMCEGERDLWDTAHDHIVKSIRSAVFCGAKYIDFHTSLNYWPELVKEFEMMPTAQMVDWKGRRIKELLKENEKLRKWFVERYWMHPLINYIIGRDTIYRIQHEAEEHAKKEEDVKKRYEIQNRFLEDSIKKILNQHLEKGEEWNDYTVHSLWLEIFPIIATYMLLTRDPLLEEIAKVCGQNPNWSDPNWFIKKINEANKTGDLKFKEFYYAVVGAKYLEGHMEMAFKWIDQELSKEIKNLPKEFVSEEEKKKLLQNAKELNIGLEVPDARDSSRAGFYVLWRPMHYIAAIKVFRKTHEWGQRVWAIIDHEHLATQGVDPKFELFETGKKIPDFGEYIISVHSGYPSPLHSHRPIEIGDVTIYELLWIMRKHGLGKNSTVYLVFERGGGQDPFKQSVTALKIFADHLQRDIPPENLGFEFFGIATPDEKRQELAIRMHALEPLKGMLMVPEEEHGFLGGAALGRGKRPEEWAKEEYR